MPNLAEDLDEGLKTLLARLDGVRDSHHLYRDQPERLYPLIQQVVQPYIGVGVVEVDELTQLNNQEQAGVLAKTRVVEALPLQPDFVLVDGRVRFSTTVPYAQVVKVKNGTPSLTIAAAAVLATVTHTRIMQELDRLYPVYGFGRHSGNISPTHLAALGKYGTSPSHHLHNRIVQGFLKRTQ